MRIKQFIKISILPAAFVFISPASAQTTVSSTQLTDNKDFEKEILNKKWEQALGTFQFQIINSRISPQVNVSIINEIEKNRDENKIVYIDYTPEIKIMILPKSTINGKFEKLNLFKYISTASN